MTYTVVLIFIAAVTLAALVGKKDKLENRLDEIRHYHHPIRKEEKEVLIDNKGIRVAKEGKDLTFDISTPKSHRRFFIPDITKKDVEDLIEGLTKLHTIM